MTVGQETNVYLLLDGDGIPLARGKIEGPISGNNWQLRVLDDKEELVRQHERLLLMAITEGRPSFEGKLMRSRNDMIQLEVTRLSAEGNDKRQNLRIKVRFHSFIYPLNVSRWKGRRAVFSVDLSCGGIAFCTDHVLEVGEKVEIVIPVTSEPVILRCEILRRTAPENSGEGLLYGARFVDLCGDEEMIIREAVFSLQLGSRPRSSGMNG